MTIFIYSFCYIYSLLYSQLIFFVLVSVVLFVQRPFIKKYIQRARICLLFDVREWYELVKILYCPAARVTSLICLKRSSCWIYVFLSEREKTEIKENQGKTLPLLFSSFVAKHKLDESEHDFFE